MGYAAQLVLVVLLQLCLGSRYTFGVRVAPRNAPLIIGGKVVTEIDASWQVAIVHKHRLICAGTVLRENVVLTAASCVKDLEPADMLVRGGTMNFKNGGQLRRIRETIYHPNFNEQTLANNLALVHIMRPFNVTTGRIRSIQLPAKRSPLPSSILVYGWGVAGREHNTTMTKNLRWAKFKMYSAKRCSQFLADPEAIDLFFCAGDRVKRINVCNDDLGGPAMMDDDIQVGIVAQSTDCGGERHTTLYTNLLPHVKWIEETLIEFEPKNAMDQVEQVPKP